MNFEIRKMLVVIIVTKDSYKQRKRELCNLIKQVKNKYWVYLFNELNNNIWDDADRIVIKKLNKPISNELTADQNRQIVGKLISPTMEVVVRRTRISNRTPNFLT